MTKERKEPYRKELKKHSAAIQIEGKITFLQRKTWNALLWNAYEELPTGEVHSISIQRLATLIGYDSKDMDYLKETSLALMRCILQYNILGKDGKNVWSAMVLLAQAKIDDGFLTYAYPPELRHRLYNPEMYARLDLDMQKRFESKYALSLWELCTDYLGSKRDAGETPWIPLEEFRQLMGVEPGEYARFNNLSIRVITPALTEINSVSDFRVTVEYQRRGRKITALKCKMSRVVALPEPAPTQGQMFPELEDMPAVVKDLTDAGLATQDALAIWQQGFAFVDEMARPRVTGGEDPDAAFRRYVQEKIHLLARQQAAGKVDNRTGFLREALRKNYANPEFAEEQRRQQAAAARQSAQQRETQRAQLERQKAVVQRQWDAARGDALAVLADTLPHVVEAAVTAALTAQPFLRSLHAATGSPLDQYRASLALRALVNPALLPHAADTIQALDAQYAPQIAALDAQIAVLS